MVSSSETSKNLTINNHTWNWKGFKIAYQSCGNQGQAVILVHGFGANSGHWRKNLPVLAQNFRCYAIDLIGFGNSAKPTPGAKIQYTFETWAEQIADFCREIVGDSVFLVGNSIGCIVTMQAAVDNPNLILGVAAINCSLRLLHERKRINLPWYRNFGASIMQGVLTNKIIGNFFFQQIAKPKVIKKILLQAYSRKEAVTDELIDLLFQPSQDIGATDVFLAFTAYSQGPLAEDLLPMLACPTILLWGTEDPWELITLGEELGKFATVEKFIPLKGLGHCPQDEAPEIVNPILQEWISEKASDREFRI